MKLLNKIFKSMASAIRRFPSSKVGFCDLLFCNESLLQLIFSFVAFILLKFLRLLSLCKTRVCFNFVGSNILVIFWGFFFFYEKTIRITNVLENKFFHKNYHTFLLRYNVFESLKRCVNFTRLFDKHKRKDFPKIIKE